MRGCTILGGSARYSPTAMRIAIFSNTYLPTISGVVRSISLYKRALEELGHEVHVFTQGASGYQDRELNVHRYVSFRIGLPNDLPITIPFSPTFDRLLDKWRPDVIHAQHPVLLGNVAQRKAKRLKVPLVYTLHAQYWEYGLYMPVRFLQRPYDYFIFRKVKKYLEGCDQIIAPSESLRNLMVAKFQVNKPVAVIPTGIDMRAYCRARRAALRVQLGWEKEFVIISVGRLAPEKNWIDLVQAVSQVAKAHPEAKLVLLGDGPQRTELVQQAKDLGLTSKIEFIGMVPYDKVPDYLVAADLFAFTSLTETQGLGTLEALAAGLPVVAYDGVGTRDIVSEGVNGKLTPANVEALASGINGLMDAPATLTKLRRGALDTATKMDIRLLAKDLAGVYENAIRQKKATEPV
jgi:1,2-diacylglycerol 3-alpha-glucosyltransferase